jgi:formamidopyrimidine-DNA glycosylase
VPELPDIALYVDALEARVGGRRLLEIRLRSPFVLRTVEPSIREAEGRLVRRVRRLAKRIVIELEEELFLVIHLMKLGRLRWIGETSRTRPPAAKVLLASARFDGGTLHLVEMGAKKRA